MFAQHATLVPRRPLLYLILLIVLYPLTSCVSPVINNIVISPATTKIARAYTSTGAVAPAANQPTVQLTAIGNYDSGTQSTVSKDITDQVDWHSYSTDLVTINSRGQAHITGILGSTQITASISTVRGMVYSNSITLIVKK